MCITVIIPSYKRAKYLKTALESVRQQTVFNKIERVIVSENSTDTEAKTICDKFTDLKIEFYQQDGSWSAIEHVSWIIEQSTTEFTAMLHDDDWWYPTHLETALTQLRQPGVSAYFSNFIFVKDEMATDATFHHSNMISYIAARQTSVKPLHLSFAEVCCLSYVYTPFHMSGTVAKTDAFKQANDKGLKSAKPWYADRILYPYLALQGTVAFATQVLVAVRNHAGNDAKTFDDETRYRSHVEGSAKIQQLALAGSVDILGTWQQKINQLPLPDVNKIYSVVQEYFGPYSTEMFMPQQGWGAGGGSGSLKRFLKNIVPYGLIKYLNKK